MAGITKLTGNHDSIVRNEKNDAAISSTANQSQPTRSARRTNDNNRARAEIVDFAQQFHGMRQANFSARAGDNHKDEDGRRAHVSWEFPAKLRGWCDAACG